ncbi:MAG: histidinol dehydrogenase [Bacteroidia bacterium]
MKIVKYTSSEEIAQLLQRPAADVSQLETTVAEIMKDVKTRGDAALKAYTEKFDKVSINVLTVTSSEFAQAAALVSDELKAAIQLAKSNIQAFHEQQKTGVLVVETMKGIECRRKSIPIDKVGLYIPGGSAPLFSTILMLAVPAVIAGCREIVLCTPPNQEGSIHPAILYAASVCGIDKVYKAGGVQAIAAMAYGTESIPKVNKIFGPGNAYVTCAKQLLAKDGIAIDLPAGPSELAVYADHSVPAAFVAADLLSQCEHGPDSQVVLVGCDEKLLEDIIQETWKQCGQLPRKQIAEKSLHNSYAILVEDENMAMSVLNDYAPEHLILACMTAEEMAEKVINAGSVFLGPWSPESAGDYASGTNHTLPTNGFAHAWSGVSLDSFYKKVTFQKLTAEGLLNIGTAVELMAEAEGLFAHKNAVTVRKDMLLNKK